MLTRMTDKDWTIVLEVFAASRSRRGDKDRDNRRFLEALHYFTVHNITWRALPPEFGNWNSIWKRFWRLSQSGVFDAFFEALASLSRTAHLVQMFDSTAVRAAEASPSQYNMTSEQYRENWGLPADYPMVAPNYARARSELARSMGLGQQRRKAVRSAGEGSATEPRAAAKAAARPANVKAPTPRRERKAR